MCSAHGKLFDNIVVHKFKDIFKTCDLQYGLKKGHSTNQCSFIVNEVVQYYRNNDSNIYLTLLDASKAFDKVNYNKLFQLLIQKGMCPLYCKFLATLYTSQLLNVKWENKFSDVFKVHNGVKQGGVLSPLLFGICIDQLLLSMKKSSFGCYIGHVYYGSLAYADDIILMSPTILGTHKLLSIADHFGKEFNISFNF